MPQFTPVFLDRFAQITPGSDLSRRSERDDLGTQVDDCGQPGCLENVEFTRSAETVS